MLQTAGLPGSAGTSAVVSLLDWYSLDQMLILVMERPVDSRDLLKYCQSRGGSLDEQEAKVQKVEWEIPCVCVMCVRALVQLGTNLSFSHGSEGIFGK